jgi:kynureninase
MNVGNEHVNQATDQYVDGQAVAGVFAEALGIEISTTTLTCTACGRSGRFAQARVYTTAPGIVARCAGCEEVIARLVRTPTDVWLDLRGTSAWRIPRPELE